MASKLEKNKQYKERYKHNRQYDNLSFDTLVNFLHKRDCTIKKIRSENKQLKQNNSTLKSELQESNFKCKTLNAREQYFSNALCNVQSENASQSDSDSDSDSDYEEQCIIENTRNITNIKDIAWAENAMYILGLRQYCHATNIPQVLEIAALFFIHNGYELEGFEIIIPSPTKCTRYSRNLACHINSIYSAVQLYCGEFKGDGHCMSRDGSSWNAIPIETMIIITRYVGECDFEYSDDNDVQMKNNNTNVKEITDSDYESETPTSQSPAPSYSTSSTASINNEHMDIDTSNDISITNDAIELIWETIELSKLSKNWLNVYQKQFH
eukprot:17544_1